MVAVEASGVREVLRDGINGRMLTNENADEFVAALESIYLMEPDEQQRLIDGALQTADEFSMPSTAARALQLYRELVRKGRKGDHGNDMWSKATRLIEEEWKIWNNVATAVKHSMRRSNDREGVP